jgi:hypothetical protein
MRIRFALTPNMIYILFIVDYPRTSLPLTTLTCIKHFRSGVPSIQAFTANATTDDVRDQKNAPPRMGNLFHRRQL